MLNAEIKVSFNGQIRIVQLCDSFSVLYTQVARTFGIERFSLKYRDADGDLITLATDVELQHAYATGIPLFFEVWPSVPPVQPIASPVASQIAQQSPAQPLFFNNSPVPSPVVQQNAPALPAFQDKAACKDYRKTHSKDEWQAFKVARKAEKMQRKAAKLAARSTDPQASASLTIPVPFPHSVIACDPTKRVLMPGARFTHTWRVRNEGIYAWPAGMMLVYDPCAKHGDKYSFFAGPKFVAIDRSLAPGEEVLLTFNLVAHQEPGKNVGVWRMSTPDQWKFGKKNKIVVKVPTPDKAEKALQKAARKAKLSDDEKRILKETKKAAKVAAKQAYWAAKKETKHSGDNKERKEAKKAAKHTFREAKKEAKVAHRNAKVARRGAAQAHAQAGGSPSNNTTTAMSF